MDLNEMGAGGLLTKPPPPPPSARLQIRAQWLGASLYDTLHKTSPSLEGDPMAIHYGKSHPPQQREREEGEGEGQQVSMSTIIKLPQTENAMQNE